MDIDAPGFVAAHRRLAEVVGVITLTWAMAENAVAMSIMLIDKNYGPIAGHPTLPVGLKLRIDYLKRSLKVTAALTPRHDEGHTLVKSLTSLKQRRHTLIQGTALHEQGEMFKTLNLRISGKVQTAGTSTPFSIDDLKRFHIEVIGMVEAALAFMQRVAKITGV